MLSRYTTWSSVKKLSHRNRKENSAQEVQTISDFRRPILDAHAYQESHCVTTLSYKTMKMSNTEKYFECLEGTNPI